jgi:hypothetical protein
MNSKVINQNVKLSQVEAERAKESLLKTSEAFNSTLYELKGTDAQAINPFTGQRLLSGPSQLNKVTFLTEVHPTTVSGPISVDGFDKTKKTLETAYKAAKDAGNIDHKSTHLLLEALSKIRRLDDLVDGRPVDIGKHKDVSTFVRTTQQEIKNLLIRVTREESDGWG